MPGCLGVFEALWNVQAVPLKVRQTSIHVPACAVEAVAYISGVRGLSRDETLRQVLAEHVDRQLELDEPDRVTHISTIMRHPLKPIHPGAAPDPRIRLSMRLPEDLAANARAVALVLPGQTRGGGIADYQARRLTDSVMTAIAAVTPLSDDVLGGLRGCIRHQAAIGLWRLAVAATLTREEQRVIDHARSRVDGHARRVVEILREEDSAWHDQFRVQVVRYLVRHFLIEGADEEMMLYDQRDGQEWAEIRDELERFGLADERFDGFEGWSLNLEGRGGSHVWRLRRRVELEEVCRWLWTTRHHAADEERTLDVRLPRWTLQVPAGWTAVPAAPLDRLPPEARQSVAAGRILLLHTSNPEQWFLWPLDGNDPRGEPFLVSGLADVTAALAGRRSRIPPEGIAELLLVVVEDWLAVDMPVHIAHRSGLIDDDTRDDLIIRAHRETRDRMEEFVQLARSELSPQHVEDLASAMDSPSAFVRIAYREGLPESLAEHLPSDLVVPPVCTWPVTSLAHAIAGHMSTPALTWLARHLLRNLRSLLNSDRMAAWQQGFDNNRHRAVWRETDARPSTCDTET
jgi:hypothetical protein